MIESFIWYIINELYLQEYNDYNYKIIKESYKNRITLL